MSSPHPSPCATSVLGAAACTFSRPRLLGLFFVVGDKKTPRDVRAGHGGPIFWLSAVDRPLTVSGDRKTLRDVCVAIGDPYLQPSAVARPPTMTGDPKTPRDLCARRGGPYLWPSAVVRPICHGRRTPSPRASACGARRPIPPAVRVRSAHSSWPVTPKTPRECVRGAAAHASGRP